MFTLLITGLNFHQSGCTIADAVTMKTERWCDELRVVVQTHCTCGQSVMLHWFVTDYCCVRCVAAACSSWRASVDWLSAALCAVSTDAENTVPVPILASIALQYSASSRQHWTHWQHYSASVSLHSVLHQILQFFVTISSKYVWSVQGLLVAPSKIVKYALKVGIIMFSYNCNSDKL